MRLTPVPSVRIDLNSRSSAHDGDTVALLEDVTGDVRAGSVIRVEEPEDGVVGSGTVTHVDREAGLIYLKVDWATLHEATTTLVWTYKVKGLPSLPEPSVNWAPGGLRYQAHDSAFADVACSA